MRAARSTRGAIVEAASFAASMLRLALLPLCAALAGCVVRQQPAAPLTRCRTFEAPVEIEGTPQRALSTYCIDEEGMPTLRR